MHNVFKSSPTRLDLESETPPHDDRTMTVDTSARHSEVSLDDYSWLSSKRQRLRDADSSLSFVYRPLVEEGVGQTVPGRT